LPATDPGEVDSAGAVWQDGVMGRLFRIAVILALPFALLTLVGCGGAAPGGAPGESLEKNGSSAVREAVESFLAACTEGDLETFLGSLHPRYMVANALRVDMTLDDMHQALRPFTSYELEPERLIIRPDGDACSSWVRLQPLASGHRLFGLRLENEGGSWRVTQFDALRWPGMSPSAVAAEASLESLLVSFVELDGAAVAQGLSAQYRARRGITGPLAPDHLTGLGSPRYFTLPADQVTMLDGVTAAATASVYFQGAQGMVKETRKVRLVMEDGRWQVDDLPFLQ
ncbi:MAG: hypothetical protein ACYC55_10395, partial [Candidatus Geothermincolia bacterium]